MKKEYKSIKKIVETLEKLDKNYNNFTILSRDNKNNVFKIKTKGNIIDFHLDKNVPHAILVGGFCFLFKTLEYETENFGGPIKVWLNREKYTSLTCIFSEEEV